MAAIKCEHAGAWLRRRLPPAPSASTLRICVDGISADAVGVAEKGVSVTDMLLFLDGKLNQAAARGRASRVMSTACSGIKYPTEVPRVFLPGLYDDTFTCKSGSLDTHPAALIVAPTPTDLRVVDRGLAPRALEPAEVVGRVVAAMPNVPPTLYVKRVADYGGEHRGRRGASSASIPMDQYMQWKVETKRVAIMHPEHPRLQAPAPQWEALLELGMGSTADLDSVVSVRDLPHTKINNLVIPSDLARVYQLGPTHQIALLDCSSIAAATQLAYRAAAEGFVATGLVKKGATPFQRISSCKQAPPPSSHRRVADIIALLVEGGWADRHNTVVATQVRKVRDLRLPLPQAVGALLLDTATLQHHPRLTTWHVYGMVVLRYLEAVREAADAVTADILNLEEPLRSYVHVARLAVTGTAPARQQCDAMRMNTAPRNWQETMFQCFMAVRTLHLAGEPSDAAQANNAAQRAFIYHCATRGLSIVFLNRYDPKSNPAPGGRDVQRKWSLLPPVAPHRGAPTHPPARTGGGAAALHRSDGGALSHPSHLLTPLDTPLRAGGATFRSLPASSLTPAFPSVGVDASTAHFLNSMSPLRRPHRGGDAGSLSGLMMMDGDGVSVTGSVGPGTGLFAGGDGFSVIGDSFSVGVGGGGGDDTRGIGGDSLGGLNLLGNGGGVGHGGDDEETRRMLRECLAGSAAPSPMSHRPATSERGGGNVRVTSADINTQLLQ